MLTTGLGHWLCRKYQDRVVKTLATNSVYINWGAAINQPSPINQSAIIQTTNTVTMLTDNNWVKRWLEQLNTILLFPLLHSLTHFVE